VGAILIRRLISFSVVNIGIAGIAAKLLPHLPDGIAINRWHRILHPLSLRVTNRWIIQIYILRPRGKRQSGIPLHFLAVAFSNRIYFSFKAMSHARYKAWYGFNLPCQRRLIAKWLVASNNVKQTACNCFKPSYIFGGLVTGEGAPQLPVTTACNTPSARQLTIYARTISYGPPRMLH
jgi:hypothetical protein